MPFTSRWPTLVGIPPLGTIPFPRISVAINGDRTSSAKKYDHTTLIIERHCMIPTWGWTVGCDLRPTNSIPFPCVP